MVILSLICCSCSREPSTQPNVILISVDTLRHDHIGLHGYARDTTPNLDRFFGSRTVLRNVASPAPCTLPAVPQFLTGSFLLDPDRPTLATLLEDRGYQTMAIVSQQRFHDPSPWAAVVRKGFSTFDVQRPDEVDRHGNSRRSAEEISDRALDFLKATSPHRPFFLWLHYFDPHDPYTPPPEHDRFAQAGLSTRSGDRRHHLMTERKSRQQSWQRAGSIFEPGDVSHLINLYDGEIRYTDFQIGRFLDTVLASGIVERSIIVFTADHGEWLGEGDRWDHCQTLHEIETRVPLFFSDRGQALDMRASTDVAASTLDIVPTILGRLGGPGPDRDRFDGDDLATVADDRTVYSTWMQDSAARSGRFKLVAKPTGLSLYDVISDFGETRDLSGERRGIRRRLKRNLDGFQVAVPPIDVQNRELLRQLRRLGYIE